jgi:hypothetical protein
MHFLIAKRSVIFNTLLIIFTFVLIAIAVRAFPAFAIVTSPWAVDFRKAAPLDIAFDVFRTLHFQDMAVFGLLTLHL